MYKELFINSKNLPQKLKEEEFLNYYEKFQNGDRKAREKLIEHNLDLVNIVVCSLVKKYYIASCYIDDVISAAMFGLMKSVDTFKLEKEVQFETYASRVITNEIFMFLRRVKKYANDISLEESINTDDKGNELTELDILEDSNAAFEERIVNIRYNAKIKDAMKKILNELEYYVIFYLYGFNGEALAQKEVAKILGISQSYVSRIEKKALKKLRKKLDSYISEVEDYQNRFRKFDVHSIHENLSSEIFRMIISFFPKHEIYFYTKHNGIVLRENDIYTKPLSGGGFSTDYENKQLELIENNIREIFLYYLHLKANKYEKNVSGKIKKYCIKHFLRFRYEEYTLDKIKQSVQNLSRKLQNVLYARHGKDLLSYNELNDLSLLYYAYRKLKEELEKKPIVIHPKSLKAIYSDLSFEQLNVYVKKLPSQYQEVIYLRHSESLDKYNKFPENKSYSAYFAMYQKAIKALEQIMSGVVLIENKKGILEKYSKEDLLYALPKISESMQKSIYLRHGKSLDQTFSWTEIKVLDGQPLSFYRNNYYRSYAFIGRVLEKRRELQEISKKTSITKLAEYDLDEIQSAMMLLCENERNVIYLKHGKNLREFYSWPTNHSFSYYRDLYAQAIYHLKMILKDKNKPLEELPSFVTSDNVKIPTIVEEVSDKTMKKVKRRVRKNSKNILTEVTREDLLWSVSYLNKNQLEILHLRHGNNLDMVLEWPEIPKDKKENYYFYSYYNVCKKIHTLLENRIKLQLIESNGESNLSEKTSSSPILQEKIKLEEKNTEVIVPKKKKKKKKIKRQAEQNPSISMKRETLSELKKSLNVQKEENLKVEFYHQFYALYGEVVTLEELENIICDALSRYTEDEGICIEYSCQFKIETAIFMLLANKYNSNPDSEESLKILIQINSIFVQKMKAKYPFIEDNKIEKAIEEVLKNYENEKSFSVELMKKLKKM